MTRSHELRPSTGAVSAVIYARVSSQEQELEGYSIPAQLKLLRAYAADRGIRVVREYLDVETAKREGRPGFGEMVRLLRREPGHAILVEKTDRLYRNLKDWVTVEELGVEIHMVKEGAVVSPASRSSEKLVHGMKVLMAKNYIDNLSEEARKGMQEKASQGIWPSFAPLGYRNVVGAGGRRTIEPDPATAPVVARLFELYASGDHSLRDLAGAAWSQGLVLRRRGRQLPRATLHKLLRNPIYMGRFRWRGVEHAGVHAPLVSEELWERAQRTLDGRAETSRRKRALDLAYAGLITCARCGCALVGEVKKERYRYYRCTGNRGRCPDRYVREEVMDDICASMLARLRLDAPVAEWVRAVLASAGEADQRAAIHRIDALKTQNQRLEKRIQRMYVDLLDSHVDRTFFDRKAQEWRKEQLDLGARIADAEAVLRHRLQHLDRLPQVASGAPDLFLGRGASDRRRVLGILLLAASWTAGDLKVTLRKPFDRLLASASDPGGGPESQVVSAA